MEKLMLIINPVAGRGAYKINLPDALLTLDKGGYRTTLFFTADRGDATEFVRREGSAYDVVVCIGGDGTLSEVVAGLMKLEKRPRLGYFPMGTSNDVATTLGLPKNDVVAAAECLVNGNPHAFDVGGFDDKYFAYIAAFGAFTDVSYATPQDQKRALGHLAYVLQGAASLGKIEPIHAVVECDEGILEGDYIYGSLSNSTSVAGIVRLSEELVSLGDGQSELVLLKDPKTVAGYGEIMENVINQHYDSENLIITHTKNVRFHFDKPVPWTRDGEEGGSYQDVELCNYKAAVDFIF